MNWLRYHRGLITLSLSLVHDLTVSAVAFLLSFVTIVGYGEMRVIPGIFDKTLAFVTIATSVSAFFRISRGSWRYVSVPDFLNIIKASIVSVILYTVAAFITFRGENVPRSVPVLTLLFMITGLCSSRLIYRLIQEYRGSVAPTHSTRLSEKARNVLLLGVSDMAESFIRSVKRNSKNAFNVVGIIDDSRTNYGRIIHGVRVLGSLNELPDISQRITKANGTLLELVVTEITPSRKRLSYIIGIATSANMKVLKIPHQTDASQLTADMRIEPRAIELSELLGRDEVKDTDVGRIAEMICGKTVMVTGAGGSIGSELCRQIAAHNPKLLILLDNSEFHLYKLDMEIREKYKDLIISACIADVRDVKRIRGLFKQYAPEVMFHAAALKHVPLSEGNPVEAIKTNFLGTRNVANAAIEFKTRTFIMISTDKAVNPTNVMGATKRAAEAYCQSLDLSNKGTRFKTVRFGNVLGSNGSVVPRFQEQIANHGPVTVTHPHIVRYFMTIPEAVRLVLLSSCRASERVDDRGKIMVLDMGEPVRIVDLAERLIQLAGLKPHEDIKIVFTGLRPGEKLFEELFDPSEIVSDQRHDGYSIASPRVIDKGVMEKTIADMEAAIANENSEKSILALKQIVPEFINQNQSLTDV